MGMHWPQRKPRTDAPPPLLFLLVLGVLILLASHYGESKRQTARQNFHSTTTTAITR